MLGGFGHVDGLELDEEARARCRRKRLGRKVMSSPLPELAEVADRHYDLIGAFDVIEHIDDDRPRWRRSRPSSSPPASSS